MIPNYIAGIGGSAGGLIAYKELVDWLPSGTGMAFVIATHMLPDATSHLVEILSKHTKMPIRTASTAMTIQANHLYVCPPNADLLIEAYTFKVISPRTKRNAVVDYLLISLAEAMEARAIGIVLSGYDGDGTEGCKQIKAARLGNLWVDSGSCEGSIEVAAEFAAGGLKGSLLFF